MCKYFYRPHCNFSGYFIAMVHLPLGSSIAIRRSYGSHQVVKLDKCLTSSRQRGHFGALFGHSTSDSRCGQQDSIKIGEAKESPTGNGPSIAHCSTLRQQRTSSFLNSKIIMRIHISAHHARYIESKGWLETAVTGRKMHVHANSSVGLYGYHEVQNQVAECTTAPV